MPLNPLASPADVGTLVGETLTTGNARVMLMIRQASSAVREYLNQQQIDLKTGDVERHAPINGVTVFLNQGPVVEVTLVEILRGSTWTSIPLDQCDIDYETGRVSIYTWSNYRTGRASTWRVTYTHGWAQDDVPDAIGDAVLGLVSRAWDTPLNVESERIGERSVKYQFAQDLDAMETTALDKYIWPGAR